MPALFNFYGYSCPDPLDKAPGAMKYILMTGVNIVLSVILIHLVTRNNIIAYHGFTIFRHSFQPVATMIIEGVINSLIFAPIIIACRKSSSILIFLIVFIPYFLLDLFVQSHYRCAGCDLNLALWYYPTPSVISFINIPVVKFLVTMSVDGIVFGILPLYLSRLTAYWLYKNRQGEVVPTKEAYNAFFNTKWSTEIVNKPSRDFAFYILRITGFVYLIYLAILVAGLLGADAWPPGVSSLISMTYENPALAINTYFKISLMIMLAFTGAYNKNLRYYTCLALFTGHLASTMYSLVFHFVKPLHATDTAFLLLSALADGLMALIFLWILLKYKKDAAVYAPEKDYSVNFSMPLTLTQYLYRSLGILFLLTAAGIVCIRLFTDGTGGIGAVFGNPDPLISNTTVLYSTLTMIAFLLAKREKLRPALFHTLSIPLIFGGIVSLLWILFSSMQGGVWIHTRVDTTVQANWYFILHAIICFLLAFLLIGFCRMYFKTDYAVNTLTPSAAINILALTNAFFSTDNKQQVSILRSVDRYVGGINGRKRGLLNLPFGLFENVLNFIYGLHPPFSTMSREEERYCLKRYFLRNEQEQKRAMMPGLAGFAYQIGISLNSLVTFAYYSNLNAGHSIGYVPVDARDRTQGDTAAYPPPFKKIADLPANPADPINFKPVMPGKEGPVVAPRVTTPVSEPDIPTEVDYLIIGSGAGGATAAYRLACAVKDPSRILVVERGNRYQPLQDFTDNEIDMMKKIYKEGGLQQTKQFTMTMMQGECLGGTTVTNNAVCFEMPDLIKKSWQQEYDIDLSGLEDEYAKVAADLNISPLENNGINQVVKSKFEQAVAAFNNLLPAAEKLNTDYPLKVNHLNTMGDGNWNLGNKRMRKRSMLETCIPWSEARGVKFISNLTAVRFTSDGNRKANSVILRTDNGGLSKVIVRKAVILAGGVLSSSHFLMRSGLANPYAGRQISCNFAFPATFEFEEELNAFDGDQITLGALDPLGRSAFETYFNPPASFALTSIPFFFDRRDHIMSRYKYLVNFGSLIGSEPNGITRKRADLLNGQSFTWTLGEKDIANIKYGLGTLVKLGQLGGAKRAILPTKPGIDLDLNQDNDVKQFIDRFATFPLRMTDLYMGTAHPQGGNLMAGRRSAFANRRVVNENFQVEGYDNVFVADASLFPTSITVNPQWTIMAMSALAVKRIIALCS
jgi:hypothetical protein